MLVIYVFLLIPKKEIFAI